MVADNATRFRVGKVNFEVTNLDLAVTDFIRLAKSSRREEFPVRLSNAYCVALASRDSSYADLFNGPGLTFPDGAPVAWVMRNFPTGSRQARRVRGPSFFAEVIDKGRKCGLRHYLFGSTDETLLSLRAAVLDRYPGALIVGVHSPRFGDLDDEYFGEALGEIDACKPDVVWVGLGTPKQDFAAATLSRNTGLPCVGVGAAFDFIAGTSKEAPVWVQQSGLEWLFRLCSEPKRLWRRYLFGNSRFLVSVIIEAWRNRINRLNA